MGKVEKKCCRSKPKRCADCPVVDKRLAKIVNSGLTGTKRRRAVKAARVY